MTTSLKSGRTFETGCAESLPKISNLMIQTVIKSQNKCQGKNNKSRKINKSPVR